MLQVKRVPLEVLRCSINTNGVVIWDASPIPLDADHYPPVLWLETVTCPLLISAT